MGFRVRDGVRPLEILSLSLGGQCCYRGVIDEMWRVRDRRTEAVQTAQQPRDIQEGVVISS